MSSNLKRKHVQDIRLVLDGSVVIPVLDFNVSFAVDQIPQATIVPALGRSLRTGRRLTLADIPHDSAGQLYVTVDGEDILILDGYINTLAAQASYTVPKVSTNASVVLIHRASKMFGSPFSSYAVFSDVTSVKSAKDRKLSNDIVVNIFGADGGRGLSNGLGVAKSLYDNHIKQAQYPGEVIRDFFIEVARYNLPAEIADVLDDSLLAYEGANYTEYTLLATEIYSTIFKAMVGAASSGNLGQAYQQAVGAMLLNFIPTNKYLIIGNPLSLMKDVDITIGSGDYAGMAASSSQSTPEPVDHVMVRYSKKALADKTAGGYVSAYFVYPPFKGQEGALATNTADRFGEPRGSYVHERNLPKWLTPEASLRKARSALSNARVSNTREDITSDEQQVLGQRYAQMYYCYLNGKRFNVPNLILPFRTDIMPGTMLQINGADHDVFGTAQLVGMVHSVTYRAQVGTNLTIQASLKDVRPAKDNISFTEGGVAMDNPGIYAERWKPVDLWGNFIESTSEQGFSETLINRDPEDTGAKNAREAAEAWLGRWARRDRQLERESAVDKSQTLGRLPTS